MKFELDDVIDILMALGDRETRLEADLHRLAGRGLSGPILDEIVTGLERTRRLRAQFELAYLKTPNQNGE